MSISKYAAMPAHSKKVMKAGKYEILKTVKKEGYKTVYSARYDNKPFILHEFITPETADHELYISEHLSIPSVDIFIEKLEEKGKTFLIQKAFTGCSALDFFSKERSLSEKISFAESLLLIIMQVHSKGVICNNISYNNISVERNGNIRLHNFASAMFAGSNTVSTLPQLLNSHFVAPECTERVEGKPSFSSDYYSFGILLYWLLTGKLPFEADSTSRLISLNVASLAASPSSVNPEIPENLSKITDILMEKNPEERYKSIEGIMYDLGNYNNPKFFPATHDMDLQFKVSDKIYGREDELALLGKLSREPGDEIKLVTVSGYSGVGKSTIVSKFKKTLSADDYWFISGKFQQYKKDIPYFAIIEAFDELFDMLLLSDQNTIDNFRTAFKENIGDQGLILTSVFPKLEMIVGKQPGVDRLVGEEAENRFNYNFLKLLFILYSRKKPLILFLDDLQWTDLVSLNVLRAITRSSFKFIMIVLCYRSNEVDRHHPLMQFLNEVKSGKAELININIKDLEERDVSQLIRDSLGCENSELSKTILDKTRGNAFFVHQVLKGLDDLGCFYPDIKKRIWKTDLKKLSNLEVSGNVLDFMQTRLKLLPENVTDLIRIIGAIGHNSDLDVLSAVTGKTKETILNLLKRPFKDGLLYRRHNHIYFSHDKIQQACYQLNPENELPALHLNIADTLILRRMYNSNDELFDLVDHLNNAFHLISKGSNTYLNLFITAALKSRDISAYKEFLTYIRKAMRLLNADISESVIFQVYRDFHIALYLNSMFNEADLFFNKKLVNHKNLFALKENYFAIISQGSMQGNYKEATEFGISILKKAGVDLELNPQKENLQTELRIIEELFEKKGIKRISDLGKIKRKNIEKMEFISELILAIVPAAFFYNPTIACLLIFTTLKLAVQNGVFEAMAYPLSVASTPFILIRNDYQAGYEYAEYAMHLAANNKRSLGNSKHLFILFCWHWSKSIRDETAVETAMDAHHLLLQGGDIQMAGYTFYNTVSYLLEKGESLELVLAEAVKGLDFNMKTQNIHGTAVITPHYQAVQTLLSADGDYLNLCADGFSESDFIKSCSRNYMAICLLYIYKMQLACIFGEYHQAYELSLKAKDLFHFITGFPSLISGIFYSALSACRVSNPKEKKWSAVINNLERLIKWNEGAPDNFRHKVYFIKAEIARKNQNIPTAIRCYIEAIVAARQNGFLHDKALMHESFSEFWKEQDNMELAEYYARQAFLDYDQWGAKRKCEQLKVKYSGIYFETGNQNLDLLSVISAQNILAQETNINKLLKQMLQILLEVSGAERVFLITENDGWTIDAFKNTMGEESILEGLKIDPDLMAADMVSYVTRTGMTASLDQFPGHQNDIYINKVKPKSVFLQPAFTGSRIIAVIYFEHTRIKNMFTANKQEMIKLLSTQIAISLNNARIYNQLEQRVQERTKELAVRNEELEIARKKADEANEAKSIFLANMSHELRTPLNAVTGFSELLSSMVSDTRQKSYLDAIKTAGRNLLTLINDILDLSKIEAGRLDISYSMISIRALLMEMEQIFRAKCESKKLDFFINLSPEIPQFVYLDEIRVRQILLNLLGNAVKFTDSGSVTVSAACVRKKKTLLTCQFP